MGRAKFTDMKMDFHRMRVEHEEVVWVVAKYRENLFNCKNELKEATKIVRSCDDSLLATEKGKEYAQVERDRAWADLEKAKGVLSDNEKALANTIWEWNTLKAHMACLGALVAQAREEAVQNIRPILRIQMTTLI